LAGTSSSECSPKIRTGAKDSAKDSAKDCSAESGLTAMPNADPPPTAARTAVELDYGRHVFAPVRSDPEEVRQHVLNQETAFCTAWCATWQPPRSCGLRRSTPRTRGVRHAAPPAADQATSRPFDQLDPNVFSYAPSQSPKWALRRSIESAIIASIVSGSRMGYGVKSPRVGAGQQTGQDCRHVHQNRAAARPNLREIGRAVARRMVKMITTATRETAVIRRSRNKSQLILKVQIGDMIHMLIRNY
jgi:hypothetical protein